MKPDVLQSLPAAMGLLTALAIGLLIGLERGWRDREQAEGTRVAGLRTFALLGLLGGVLGHLVDDFGPWPLALGLLALTALLAVAYWNTLQSTGNRSITSHIAMLLTLALGAMAARGQIELALSAAVIVTVLLDLKQTLHQGLRLIEHRELAAGLQLLVLSVVILPNLPDAGFGPYQALNPYRLWWAVVLIAGLSMAGHLAMRVSGPQRGMLLSGLLGGLASSTAATLALSRHARQDPALRSAAVAGTLAASGTMCLRMTALLAMLAPGLLIDLGLPLLVSGALLLLGGVRIWRQRSDAVPPASEGEQVAPFDLSTALGFGVFLALIAVLVPTVREWLGASGVYGLAALSGLADVDAMLISLSSLHSQGGLTTQTTVLALSLTIGVNMLTKAGMAWSVGGQAMGVSVLRGYALGMGPGGVVLLFLLMR